MSNFLVGMIIVDIIVIVGVIIWLIVTIDWKEFLGL